MKNLQEDLLKLGITKYTKKNLSILYKNLLNQIPNKTYGKAINITLSNEEKTEDDKFLICSCGGTNWVISIAKIVNEKFKIETLIEKRFILESDKKFSSFESFIEQIEILIEKSLLKVPDIKLSKIAISLAFPISNTETEYGIDAKLLNQKLPKDWHVEYNTKGTSPYIGKQLLLQLNQKTHNSFEKIIIVNDVTSLGIDSDAGFVFGTGINAIAEIDEIVWNTEVGKSLLPKGFISKDKVLKKQLLLSNDHNPTIEYLIGGDCIRDRFAIGVDLLTNEGHKLQQGLSKQFMMLESEFVSDLANPTFLSKNLKEKYSIFYLSKEEIKVLKTLATNILKQTSQIIGVVIASVLSVSDVKSNKEVNINLEGSVILKGYNIKKNSLKTASLLTDMTINASDSSSILGLAKLFYYI